MSPSPFPTLRLLRGKEKSVIDGHPWVFAGDFTETAELLGTPGALVEIRDYRDRYLATGTANIKADIACRILTRSSEPIDEAFFQKRLCAALDKRSKLFREPYYRLIHSESDFLPGLIIDRFANTLVCQISTAGMERLQPLWLAALEALLHPDAVLLRNDIPSRKWEGLGEKVDVIKGTVPPLVELIENDCTYYADLMKGQKTGWFFDMRDNRLMVAKLAKGKTVLDMYSHSGGFGILAAAQGAAHVTMADASTLALSLATRAAEKNGIAEHCDTVEGDAFTLMPSLAKQGKCYDIVIADPPAFIPGKQHLATGLKGYEKVARLSSALVAPGGHLFIASCSHHATRPLFKKSVLAGIKKSSRKAAVLKETGASADHPVHPKLPQSEYLKGLLLQIN